MRLRQVAVANLCEPFFQEIGTKTAQQRMDVLHWPKVRSITLRKAVDVCAVVRKRIFISTFSSRAQAIIIIPGRQVQPSGALFAKVAQLKLAIQLLKLTQQSIDRISDAKYFWPGGRSQLAAECECDKSVKIKSRSWGARWVVPCSTYQYCFPGHVHNFHDD